MTEMAGITCDNCGTYAYDCMEGREREEAACCNDCSHKKPS